MMRESDELTLISEQAAHWWVVFHGGGASSAERREFAQWIVLAPERVEAYLRVARVHVALTRNDLRWPKTPTAALVRDALASPQEPIPLRVQRARPEGVGNRRLPVLVGLGFLASVLLAVGAAWHFLSGPEQFRTKFGERLSVVLADGSRVTLNTDSKIEVRMQADLRIVRLIQGEALFDVVHNARRPFEVRVGRTTLRDLGTQFDVDLRRARTIVTVVEGRVGIIAAGASGGKDKDLPVLSATDRATIDNEGSIKLQHEVNTAEATGWMRGSLIFHRRPMGEVADEFNRYNHEQIDIRSPALRALEITGTFRTDDLASFLAYVTDIPGVRIAKDISGGYSITREDSAAP